MTHHLKTSIALASLFLSFSCLGQRLFDANLVLTISTGPADIGVPPTNSFVRAIDNPIQSASWFTNKIQAENIAYDPSLAYYFMVTTVSTNGVGLFTNSVDPRLPNQWYYVSNLTAVNSSSSPHLLRGTNTYWYLFSGANASAIQVSSNTSPYGPFSTFKSVVSTGSGWESSRVLESYVFQRDSDGLWVMVYMGDSGSTTEQVGYATASDPGGPWTKYASNPLITFGSAGTYDAGTIADPWVVLWNGIYYIGYASGYAKTAPWQTALASTTDWTNITKLGIILQTNFFLWEGFAGAVNDFRGAVTKVGRTYILSYTGDNSDTGIATEPADTLAPTISGLSVTATNAYTANVYWTTDPNAISTVGWSTNSGIYTNSVAEDYQSNFTHNVILYNLSPSTTYYCAPFSTNILSTSLTTGSEFSFATPAAVTGDIAPDIAWFKFEEGTGTVITNAAQSTNGVIRNSSQWHTGIYNGSANCLTNNGTSDFFNTTNAIAFNTNVITVTCWFNLPANPSSAKILIESSVNSNLQSNNFGIWFDNTSTMTVNLHGSGDFTHTSQRTYTTPSLGVWHHYAFVLDRSTAAGRIIFYLDGQPQLFKGVTSGMSGDTLNFLPYTIYGLSRGAITLFLAGMMDDLRIYSGELTKAQILTIRNHPQ